MKFQLQNKNNKTNILSIYSVLFLILISFINLPYTLNSTLEEIHEAIKEVAYSFYMRGRYVQFSDSKFNAFHPEDATEQKMNFLVCWTLVQAIYTEMLNITIPLGDGKNFYYSSMFLGSPEVVVYNKKNEENTWYFYDPTKDNNITTLNNPNLKRDIIPILQTGDIISYTGHTYIIYDIERDSNGKAIDAIIMETSISDYIISKLATRLTLAGGRKFGDDIDFLFYDIHNNPYNFKTGIEQGTITIRRISTIPVMFNIDYPEAQYRRNEYCILRFIQKDSKGNAFLSYKNIFYANDKYYPNEISNNELIKLPKRNLDRIKFHHIYIEKTLNKHNGGFVDIGERLIYKIIVKNGGDKDYNNSLIVTENLSKYVTFEAHYEINRTATFEYNINKKKLIWNIGKLKKGEEITIYYYVKVTSGKPGDIIENPGFVGNIPSSKVVNTIGKNLDDKKKDLIKKKFEELKKHYEGKKLINEIYEQLFGIDIEFDKLDLTNLIIHQNPLTLQHTIMLNKTNKFYGAILNNYWNSLMALKSPFYEGGEELDFSKLLYFGRYPERRQDFIYSGTFRNGDILLYINNYDATYKLVENQNVVKTDITYECGEYAYIYIEGKGFVGVNKGKDKNSKKDDRNEFNAKYYEDNKLELFYQVKKTNVNNEFLEMANLQTVFGKDYYVILRPSIIFDFKYNEDNNLAKGIFIIILLIFILLGISLYIFKRIRNNSEIDSNEVLFAKGLINN